MYFAGTRVIRIFLVELLTLLVGFTFLAMKFNVIEDH